jgi:hypothetical protein
MAKEKHGLARSAEHQAWRSMKHRCLNPRAQKYADYGGRGIRVCARWAASFSAFFTDVGPRPTSRHSLGRIDNDGNYEPGNVRWETLEEQRGNSRQNRVVEAFGRKQIVTAWAREVGISVITLRTRLRRGWSPEMALSTPAVPGQKLRPRATPRRSPRR